MTSVEHQPTPEGAPAPDQRQGAFVSGGTVFGPVIGENTGEVVVIYNPGDQVYDVRGLGDPPYQGLSAFTYDDRETFAGRSAVVAATVERLMQPGEPLALLWITGASGSGKSSFAQAGLLPALEVAYQRTRAVRWAVFRPSRHPLAALRAALERLQLPTHTLDLQKALAAPALLHQFLEQHTPPNQVNVIIVDQFEELFTQSNAEQRDALFTALETMPPFSHTRTHVIPTMRSDYLPELFERKALYDIAKVGVDLRAMSEDELKEAIQLPLRWVLAKQKRPLDEKRWEASLLDCLAYDAAQDATYLPLLQVTLEEIWNRGILKLDAYRQTHSGDALAQALQQRAEYVYHYALDNSGQPTRRPEADQATIMAMLLDLVAVSLDDDARRDVRRRQTDDDLVHGSPDRARLLEELVNARLLSRTTERRGDATVEADVVDIIHEALIRTWERLQAAIASQRQVLQRRERFEQALREWQVNERNDQYLLDGVRLAEAENLHGDHDIVTRSEAAQTLIRLSIAQREAERQQELARAQALAEEQARRAEAERERAEVQTQATQRQRQFTWLLAGVAVIAIIAGAYGWDQRNAALTQARLAFSRQLAAQALSNLDDDLDLGLLLSIAAMDVSDTAEARNSLLHALQWSPWLHTFLTGAAGDVRSVAIRPDGAAVATGHDDGRIMLWNMATSQLAGALPAQADAPFTGAVVKLAWSPDGATLLAGSMSNTLTLWDVATRTPRATRSDVTTAATTFRPWNIGWSADGQGYALVDELGVRSWNISSGAETFRPFPPPAGAFPTIEDVALSADGKRAAIARTAPYTSTHVILLDLASDQPPVNLVTTISPVASADRLAFDQSGAILAIGYSDFSIQLWDIATRQPRGAPLLNHRNPLSTLAINTQNMLASADQSGFVVLWNLTTHQYVGVMNSSHKEVVESVAWHPDGSLLVSDGANDALIVWNIRREGWLMNYHNVQASFKLKSSVSNDGRRLAVEGFDRTVVWDIAGNRSTGEISGTSLFAQSAWSPDSTLLAMPFGNKITLWDIERRRAIEPPLTMPTLAWGVAWSADGSTLAAIDSAEVILWDVKAHQERGRLPINGGSAIAFSPSGTMLAVGAQGNQVQLWDIASRKLVGAPLAKHRQRIESLAFSPDGRWLASGGSDKYIYVWDLQHGQHIDQPFAGHAGAVMSLIFSPDSKLLASGSMDRSVLLWDIALHAPLGQPLYHSSAVSSLAFTPDGATLVSASSDGQYLEFDINLSHWIQRACTIANRSLTPVERKQFLGDRPPTKDSCAELAKSAAPTTAQP